MIFIPLYMYNCTCQEVWKTSPLQQYAREKDNTQLLRVI